MAEAQLIPSTELFLPLLVDVKPDVAIAADPIILSSPSPRAEVPKDIVQSPATDMDVTVRVELHSEHLLASSASSVSDTIVASISTPQVTVT